jgi:RHS repeat-associated protein
MDDRQIKSERYRYGYQGQFAEYDSLTKLNSFELRMYDPRFGRMNSPDSYGQFASSYSSMANNPVSAVDPDGGYVFILGPRRNFLAQLLGGMVNLKIGNSYLREFINNPHRHVYISFGKIVEDQKTQGITSGPYSQRGLVLQRSDGGTPNSFFVNPSSDFYWTLANTFNGQRIPKLNTFWEADELNLMVIDDSKIGSNNLFGMYDAIGHEFSHAQFDNRTDRNLVHTDPNVWGTPSMQNPNSLNLNSVAGQYGREVLNYLNKGQSTFNSLWLYSGFQFITTDMLGIFMQQSAIRVPVNGVIRWQVPTIR